MYSIAGNPIAEYQRDYQNQHKFRNPWRHRTNQLHHPYADRNQHQCQIAQHRISSFLQGRIHFATDRQQNKNKPESNN